MLQLSSNRSERQQGTGTDCCKQCGSSPCGAVKFLFPIWKIQLLNYLVKDSVTMHLKEDELCTHCTVATVQYSAVHKMLSSSKQEIDLHVEHMSTIWSGHLTSCQSLSDLLTSNMFYANQIKIIIKFSFENIN